MTQQTYTSEDIFNIKEIKEIIMEYKKEIDMANDKLLLKQWTRRKRIFRDVFEEAVYNVKQLRKRIKLNCKHTDVTEHIRDGYERSLYSYTCNQCSYDVSICDDFNYKHITKTKDSRC